MTSASGFATGCSRPSASTLRASLPRAASRSEARSTGLIANYYLELAEAAESQLAGHEQLTWHQRLEAEHDNIRAALSYCLDDLQPEPGLRLATAMLRFWTTSGHGSEGAGAISAQLQRSETAEPSLVRARALAVAGALLSQEATEFQAAEAYCEQALAIARAHDDDYVAAEALCGLGWTRLRQGRAGEATDPFQKGVAFARRAADERLLAKLLTASASRWRMPTPTRASSAR
jgi:hypothetical protein